MSRQPPGRTAGARAKTAARTAGLTTYFTGIPCKNGHVSERWVSCGSCIGCQQAAKPGLKTYQAAYGKTWRKRNREILRLRQAARRLQNPGQGAAYMRRRRQADREAMLTQERARYAKDPQKFMAKTRAYLTAEPDRQAAYARTRRARKAGAEGSHTADDIAALLIRQKGRCAGPRCGKSIRRRYHADHIVPLVLGGSNWISNIQLLCPTCNMRKGPKHPIVFAQQRGCLL